MRGGGGGSGYMCLCTLPKLRRVVYRKPAKDNHSFEKFTLFFPHLFYVPIRRDDTIRATCEMAYHLGDDRSSSLYSALCLFIKNNFFLFVRFDENKNTPLGNNVAQFPRF